MFINKVCLETGVIDVSSDDNFGLALESNINVTSKFYASATGGMNMMHKIMRVGTSVSKKSLGTKNEMVQERWGIHSSVAKKTVEPTTQRGIKIL